ncbi:MAG: PhnD/SsuA/transferrin family substrate-binding protein [Thermodesulfovibrionales bacterium]
MKVSKIFYMFVFFVSAIALSYSSARADQFKIAIMQDERGAAAKYRQLETYLKGKGIEFSFVGATNYPAAAKMFASGEVDAMFSGSGIAGTFFIKDLATPLLRPVNKEGVSTYHATIVARKGSPKFTGHADYFNGKKVIFTPLASAGEFFYHSIDGIESAKATTLKAASHAAAIEALANKSADVAIVKNHIWNKLKSKYPDLTSVGEDDADNPDGTLIVSKKADSKIVSKVSSALLALKDDKSKDAQAARDELGIQSYIKTTTSDFKHTLELLKKAGVDKSFNFSFK